MLAKKWWYKTSVGGPVCVRPSDARCPLSPFLFTICCSLYALCLLFPNIQEQKAVPERHTLPLTELTAISPLDGRYASSTAGLRNRFSEYALIR